MTDTRKLVCVALVAGALGLVIGAGAMSWRRTKFKTRHFSSLRSGKDKFGRFIFLLALPEKAPFNMRDGAAGKVAALMVAVVTEGGPCRVLESLVVEGERHYKVRARGRDVDGKRLMGVRSRLVMDAWDGSFFPNQTTEDDEKAKAQWDATPETDVVGWTHLVADD